MNNVSRGALAFAMLAICASVANGQYAPELAGPSPYPTTSAPNDVFPGPALQPPAVAALPASNPYAALLNTPTDAPYEELLPPPNAEASANPPSDDSIQLLPEGSLEIIEAPMERTYSWYDPLDWFHPNPWSVEIEFGLNGSTGTNESLSINSGGKVKHKTPRNKFVADASYNKTSSGKSETQNNETLDLRNDWKLAKESRWSLFGMGTLFYDEFQAFDLQVNANSGIGYKLIDKEWIELTSRVGSGTSREFGGPTDRWIPEGNFGLDYEQQIFSNQKLTAKVDYFPQWEQYEEFRLVTEVGWEIELVEPSNMSLKIQATDRYDSTPDGSDPQILNYSALIIWKL